MPAATKKPLPKPHLFEPRRALRKFNSIGLDGDTLDLLELCARDDRLSPRTGTFSRVESFCIRSGIVGLSKVLPFFLLATKYGKATSAQHQEIFQVLRRIVRELNHSKSQLTSMVDHHSKTVRRKKTTA